MSESDIVVLWGGSMAVELDQPTGQNKIGRDMARKRFRKTGQGIEPSIPTRCGGAPELAPLVCSEWPRPYREKQPGLLCYLIINIAPRS
jgi:hypothetical protein